MGLGIYKISTDGRRRRDTLNKTPGTVQTNRPLSIHVRIARPATRDGRQQDGKDKFR